MYLIRNKERKTRKSEVLESHCHFLLLDRGGVYAIKTASFEVEEGGWRQRLPSMLWFGGSCSSIVV